MSLLLVTLLSSKIVLAATTPVVDNKANIPLNIKSDKQSFDLKTNTATFTGHVIVTRGSAVIQANQATLHKSTNGAETVDATGAPVNFTSTLSNGKVVTGSATKLHYDIEQDNVTLTGNAYLKQADNSIRSELIHYSIKNEEMTASGNKNQQVSTVIIPNEVSQPKAQQNKANDGKISR